MYCKNCGNEVSPNQAVCLGCGCQPNVGDDFCPNCGNATAPGAVVCLNCGVALQEAALGTAPKSKMIAGLLAIFLGQLGIHNFYLGYTKKALIQLLVAVGLSWTFVAPVAIWGWAIYEAVQIFKGELPDANGNRLAD